MTFTAYRPLRRKTTIDKLRQLKYTLSCFRLMTTHT